MALYADPSTGALLVNADGSIFDTDDDTLAACCCEDTCMEKLLTAIYERQRVVGISDDDAVDTSGSYSISDLVAIVNSDLAAGSHFVDPDDNSWNGGTSLPASLNNSSWAAGVTTCENLFNLVVTLQKTQSAGSAVNYSSRQSSGWGSGATLSKARTDCQSNFAYVDDYFNGAGAYSQFSKDNTTYSYGASVFSPLWRLSGLYTGVSHSAIVYVKTGSLLRGGIQADLLTDQGQDVNDDGATWHNHASVSSTTNAVIETRLLDDSTFPGDYDSGYEGTAAKYYGFGMGTTAVITWDFTY